MQSPLRIISGSNVELESFHDCHVHGLHWRRDHFTFSMDLQYILEWIAPHDDITGYRFSVCEARVTFRNVDDLKVSMDWSGAMLDSEIDAVRTSKARTTPSLLLQSYYEIDFSDPEATISFWSTGFEIGLLSEPVISRVPSIPMSDKG